MNIKKSIEVSLAHKGKSKTELCRDIGVCRGALSRMLKVNRCSVNNLIKIAGFFEMTVGDFVKAGEDR